MLKSSAVKNSNFVSSSKWNRQSQKDNFEESAFVKAEGGGGGGGANSHQWEQPSERGAGQWTGNKVCVW